MKAFVDTKEVPQQNADWDIFKCVKIEIAFGFWLNNFGFVCL